MVTLKPIPREYWVQMNAVAAFDQMLTNLWPERTYQVGLRLWAEMDQWIKANPERVAEIEAMRKKPPTPNAS